MTVGRKNRKINRMKRFPSGSTLLAVPISLALAAVGPISPTSAEEPRLPRPVLPADRPNEWIPDPDRWESIEEASLVDPGGGSWRIEVEARRIGWLQGEQGRVPVPFPRVRFDRIAGRDTTTLAFLAPVDSRDIALFPPGSPEISAVPDRLTEDAVDRWPNPCRISILDGSGQLDLDADGAVEIALRRSCSCATAGCSGIVLVELSPTEPGLLDPADLVDGLQIGIVVLVRLDPGEETSRPILRLNPLYLEDCRFIAAAGVRGSNECPDCCRFPVLLRPIAGGRYEPYYDRPTHQRLLERAKNDIESVAAGLADEPLLSFEEAQVARAAAFFYLTGAGGETQTVLLDALGARARNPRVRLFLNRLDGFFRPPAGR